ncbi:TetR/AcrR family transcriptional regulator [Sulfitobacter sp. AS59]|uniref:TetR/AcrR family transcriptional regulator n=1 Tax=Sulfitobacter sp. AS59 TaxID=3135784 RepID=UPI0031751A16
MNLNEKTKRAGDLRQTLISAGIELLQSGGANALTLRKCAARAGVSHAAPAHHFDGIEGLLTAIAARGHEMFAATMLAHLSRASNLNRDRLYSICEGYLEFSASNQALYGLMFNSGQIDFCDPDLGSKSHASFEILEQCCAPLRDTNTGPLTLEITIWSLLHGYCSFTKKAREGSPKHPANRIPFQQLFDYVVPSN